MAGRRRGHPRGHAGERARRSIAARAARPSRRGVGGDSHLPVPGGGRPPGGGREPLQGGARGRLAHQRGGRRRGADAAGAGVPRQGAPP
ncbi:hypothetical protein DAI22_05g202500 [Oryza sativa Japonica Group]|nr:hypothetical protein DAI22_05g202500 [Oryza sativa Japonica Group]